jgi:t-SNARE complex subunit (syntaxin)
LKSQDAHKKVPLLSSQKNNVSDIEKQVDEILNAHREVLQRGREHQESSVNTQISDRSSKVKRPSLFFMVSKKKTTEGAKQRNLEKKPAPPKEKKRIGFGKKKKEKVEAEKLDVQNISNQRRRTSTI